MLSRDRFIYTGHVSRRVGDSRYRLAQLAGDRASILDVGCAVGYIGEFFRQTPPHRWLAGIEVDPRAAKEARPHYDQLIIGDIESAYVWSQLQQDVDAMIFGDVLEHTADPIRVLGIARQHLKPGGIAIISVPNIAHFRVRLRLLMGRFEYQEWGIMDRTHLRFFTRATAQQALRAAAFDVVHTEPILAYASSNDVNSLPARLARAARARVRISIGTVLPTLIAQQFILVGVARSNGT